MERAQDDMETNPRDGGPTRPVVAAKHIYSAHDRKYRNEFDPYEVVWERMPRLKLDRVINDPNHAYGDVNPGDDRHGQRTLVHVAIPYRSTIPARQLSFDQAREQCEHRSATHVSTLEAQACL